MKAFGIDRYGKPDQVRLAEHPDPEMRADDVLIEIHAASVNPVDLLIRGGKMKPLLPLRLPVVLGSDLAGVVREVGPLVKQFKPGDAVYAKPNEKRLGTFAEYIAVAEAEVAHKPERVTMEESAAVALVGLTAWQALVETAKVKSGQKVLVHAGSGGVGSVAIQLAKHLGAVVATTTSATNVEWVRKLGADLVIDYKSEDFAEALRGYDVVVDTIGGDVLTRSLRVLKPGGRIVSLVGPPDPHFAEEFGLNLVLKQGMRLLSYRIRRKAKRHDVSYSFLFMKASGSQLHEIASLVDAGIIDPVIDRTFPFRSTNEALAYVETGRVKGKVVVKVR